MKKILILNWKMNPQSLGEAKRLFDNYLKILKPKTFNLKPELVIAPPFVYLNELKNLKTKKLKNLKLGAQDVFWENFGAYTGEISPKMLKNLDVEYVIIGHSERRKYLGETDEMINKKVLAGLKAGLKVVLCIGEDLLIRKRGKKAVEKFIRNQLKKDLKGLTKSHKLKAKSLIIAYEPVWAIGTGVPCRPEDASEMIKYIKQCLKPKTYNLKPKVLYGGSVSSKNIAKFLKHPEINGALIGGASLKVKEVKRLLIKTRE